MHMLWLTIISILLALSIKIFYSVAIARWCWNTFVRGGPTSLTGLAFLGARIASGWIVPWLALLSYVAVHY